MTEDDRDPYWVHWKDPSDGKSKMLAVSSVTGHYWTDDPEDPLIVDTSVIPIKHTIEDTITQIAEKYKMKKGRQYERFNLFRHYDPKVHAYLAVEKRPDGTRDVDTGKINRAYQAYWTHKFKLVTCLSRLTGRCNGNPGLQDKEYSKKNVLAAKEARKRKLANSQQTAKKLNFDPLQRLALYAMGDKDRLGLTEDIKPTLQLKSLEIYLKYSHQQMKPFNPQEMDRLKGNDNTPQINIVLPSDGSENEQHVLTHKDQTSLDDYIKTGSRSVYDEEYSQLKTDDESFNRERFMVDLPEEEDEDE